MIRTILILASVILATSLITSTVCAATIANRNPTGETFPRVTGQSLEQEPVVLPDEFSGKPVVLLIGYQQRTQFDIDRWMLGLLQTDLQARIVEVPKIPGLIPSLGSGWIDDGMRAGIPEEDWGAVVTLNGCAAKPVAEFTGTEYGKRARVIVLASEGQVVWFSDRCYSASQALEVADLVTTLQGDRIRCVLDPFCGDSIDDASVRDINENNLLISGCFIS